MDSDHSYKVSTILIVDDEDRNRKLLHTLLAAEGYRTIAAASGGEALALASNEAPDLILLDVMMPGMDGFETVARLKAHEQTRRIPVIMITSLDDRESKLKALQAGSEEFLSKPIDRSDLSVRVRNLLRLKEYSDFLEHHNEILARQVKDRTAQLEDAYRETLVTLVRASEFKDEDTGDHISRIGLYSGILARELGMDAEFCETIRYAAPMHDVGKIGIPDSVLLKKGALSPEEWCTMRTHSSLGADILSVGHSRYLRMGVEIARSHHERWDGSGYPDGLSGDEIPLPARITQICDVYDALRSRRPYKQGLDHTATVDIITRGDGRTLPGHFDPEVLNCFRECSESFQGIFDTRVPTEESISA